MLQAHLTHFMIGAIMLTLNPNRAVKRQKYLNKMQEILPKQLKKFMTLNIKKGEYTLPFVLFLVAQR